jgi:hypothetical protein
LYLVVVCIIVGAFLIAYLVTIIRCKRDDIPEVVRAFGPWFSKATVALPAAKAPEPPVPESPDGQAHGPALPAPAEQQPISG